MSKDSGHKITFWLRRIQSHGLCDLQQRRTTEAKTNHDRSNISSGSFLEGKPDCIVAWQGDQKSLKLASGD